MKKCSKDGCSERYYAKGYCRNHYRTIINQESKKYWGKILKDERLHEGRRNSFKKWYSKIKDTDYNKERNQKHWAEWYPKNKEKFIKYVKKWKKLLPIEKLKEYRQKDNATREFGSWKLREFIIQRDGEKCIRCGITREEHKKRWNQDLHVDHKDNYGRNVIKEAKNNKQENLGTFCIRCHRSKSSKEQWDQKREELLIYGKDFTEDLKEKIRNRSGRICEDCGKTEKQNKKKLDVHHINGNKHDNQEGNLIPLCTICHNRRESFLRKNK